MKPTDLRGILQYIPRFREKIFVISIDGAIVTVENFANILLDIAVLRSLNIRVVLVHGASAQIQRLAQERGMVPSDLEGGGITDAATLQLALTASNRLTHEILEGLSSIDLKAACPNALVAYPLGILQGIDHLLTGKVEKVDTEFLLTLLNQGIIPVIPPLGFDGDGKTYRLNSDSVAVSVAESLKATKVIFITTQEGLIYQDQVIRQMLVSDLDNLLKTNRDRFLSNQLSKATHAVSACLLGVPRVHIINGQVDEGLLAEVFSNEGVGTLIYGNEYQQVRKALKKDIRSILKLTRPSMASDELVKRTRVDVEKDLADYYLFEIDRNPVACVALHVYPEQNSGELACLYVNPSHENQGIGRKLIHFVEAKARELGLQQLIVLSTQAFTYFQSKAGYVEGAPEMLPPERLAKYNLSGRNSKVLVKRLTKAGNGSSLPRTA